MVEKLPSFISRIFSTFDFSILCSSNVSMFMKQRLFPSVNVYCISVLVTSAAVIGSPARNVLSCTEPLTRFLIFVRTKAEPFPGFTCKNSRSRTGTLSMQEKLIQANKESADND